MMRETETKSAEPIALFDMIEDRDENWVPIVCHDSCESTETSDKTQVSCFVLRISS